MKYVVILGDGMADEPIEALDGRTPLEAAKTPTMDQLAKDAEIGLLKTIPDGMKPGSDTANLSVLGYDARKYYTGRADGRYRCGASLQSCHADGGGAV